MTEFFDQPIREKVAMISYSAESLKDAITTNDEDRFRDLISELSLFLSQIRRELNIPTPLHSQRSYYQTNEEGLTESSQSDTVGS